MKWWNFELRHVKTLSFWLKLYSLIGWLASYVFRGTDYFVIDWQSYWLFINSLVFTFVLTIATVILKKNPLYFSKHNIFSQGKKSNISILNSELVNQNKSKNEKEFWVHPAIIQPILQKKVTRVSNCHNFSIQTSKYFHFICTTKQVKHIFFENLYPCISTKNNLSFKVSLKWDQIEWFFLWSSFEFSRKNNMSFFHRLIIDLGEELLKRDHRTYDGFRLFITSP